MKKDPLMAVSIAGSFDELYRDLKAIGSVKDADKTYSPAQLIKIIEKARRMHGPLELVTKAHGIRDSVERLLRDDGEYLKAMERRQKKSKSKRRAA